MGRTSHAFFKITIRQIGTEVIFLKKIIEDVIMQYAFDGFPRKYYLLPIFKCVLHLKTTVCGIWQLFIFSTYTYVKFAYTQPLSYNKSKILKLRLLKQIDIVTIETGTRRYTRPRSDFQNKEKARNQEKDDRQKNELTTNGI